MRQDETRATFREMTVFLGGICCTILLFVFIKSRLHDGHLIDGQGFFLGRDFLNFWHYGIAAWSDDPVRWYDDVYYNGVLDRLLPGLDYGYQQFSYPPHYMLLAAPFGLIGYYWALALFTGLGLLAYARIVTRPFEDVAYRRALWLAPPLVICLICGQISILLTVLFITIYRTLDTRPLLAGLLIALMTVKPQVGFLFPVFLLATGRYRVFAAASAGTVAFIGASVLLHGVEVWEVYFDSGIANQSRTLVYSHPWTLALMPTTFVNLIVAGMAADTAMLLHGLLAIGAAIAMAWGARRAADPLSGYAMLVGAAFVATPYLMVYDTLVLVWVVVALAERDGLATWQHYVLRLLMALGPLGLLLVPQGLPGTALVLWVVFWWTLRPQFVTAPNRHPASVEASSG